jgi:hypothetical protein
MKIDEIEDEDKFEYREECKNCGRFCTVLTQRDNYPEYYTYVYIQCVCGDYIKFDLPVN